MNKCWLCEKMESNTYCLENTNKTMSLRFVKVNNEYRIIVDAEDRLEQDISYCPICGRYLYSKEV